MQSTESVKQSKDDVHKQGMIEKQVAIISSGEGIGGGGPELDLKQGKIPSVVLLLVYWDTCWTTLWFSLNRHGIRTFVRESSKKLYVVT
ncbi:hypothetical protein V6N13_046839 [Hibiscus sabdariffa]